MMLRALCGTHIEAGRRVLREAGITTEVVIDNKIIFY
jgi:hypothetical protein